MSLKKLGRYDLIRVLGKGAMGLVYEGRDPNLDRRVAIKTIKVENLSDEAAAEYEVRFRTEARSAARLQHPNIVSVYDSDRDGDIAFLVMEYVEGDDLKHHLDKGEIYSLQQTLGIMADLLSALHYAHQQKVLHRDIKPANLLVQASGRIKLADFGVARIQDSGDVTRTQGSIVGTLKYMSPEQLEGRPIDARADLFAAGVVLYQLLTSQRPFDGDTDFAVIQKIVNHMPAAATVHNPKLPPAIDAVVAKALAKSRDMRYGTAVDFSVALQAACRQAGDNTAALTAVLPGEGDNILWAASMMPGESLLATASGTGMVSGAESGITSGKNTSLVTQEVELVYWKDIKESIDVEDIQGFLTKFPSGIYADLARRRLKNLYDAMPADRTATLVSPQAPVPAAWIPALTPAGTDADKTLLLPKCDGLESDAPADPAKPTARSALAAPQPAAAQAASATSPKKAVWLLASVAALALAGVAFKLLSGSVTAPAPTVAMALAGNATSQFSAPAPAPAVAAQSDTSAAASSSRPAASAAAVATRATLAASKAATPLSAKKTAPDKEKTGKDSGAIASDSGQQATKPATSTRSALPAKVSSPRAACEHRMLLAFQSCMSEQCARPVFTQHPICIERRGMDESRREMERNR